MNTRSNTCLLWFLKAPVKGQVKSRLAASIGEKHAQELYCCFLKDLLKRVKSLSLPVKVYFTPAEEQKALSQLLGDDFPYLPQQGKDLGERLDNAFKETFSDGYDNILVIGGDSPDLPDTVFAEAQESLNCFDAVIGPAHDGGYYLLGIQKAAFHSSIFAGISWGSEKVFDETSRRFKKLGITCRSLSVRHDIDTFEDLKELRESNQHTSFADSHTLQYVRKQNLE